MKKAKYSFTKPSRALSYGSGEINALGNRLRLGCGPKHVSREHGHDVAESEIESHGGKEKEREKEREIRLLVYPAFHETQDGFNYVPKELGREVS